MKHLKKLTAATTIAFSLTAFSAQAEWHALVVGIDDYKKPFEILDGAVNDANDISDALKVHNVKPTVLLNQDAKYATISHWWDKTIEQVAKGDTVVFTMSGHGSLEPEHYPGTDNAKDKDRNSQDETFVLSGYEDAGKASKERIVDQEILGWAKKATDKGARVIVVTDFCFGAGATRSLTTGQNLGDKLFKLRSGAQINPEDKTKRGSLSDAQLSVESPKFNNNLFIITPHDKESLPIPETHIDGKTRGLASYLFGQLLRGKGDTNGDGKLTLLEMSRHLRQQSVALSGKQQKVIISPANSQTRDIAVLGEVVNTPSAERKPSKPSVYVTGKISDLGAKDYTLAKQAKTATYRWDRKNATITKSSIGVVAYDIGNEADLLSFLANADVVNSLLNANIPPVAGNIVLRKEKDIDKTTGLVFVKNDEVAIYSGIPPKFRHLILVNIPAKGAPQLIGYLPTNQLQKPSNGTKELTQLVSTTRVTPPFGSDHLVFIALTDKAVSSNAGFKVLMKEETTLSAKDRDKLLNLIKDVPKKEIGLGIVPFSTAK